MADLKNKIAIVTGGTGVLGSAFCHALAQAGAHVVVISRRKEVAENLAIDLSKLGPKAIGLAADVLQIEQIEQANKQILEQFGRIDILVNAAGGNIPAATITPDKTFFDIDVKAINQAIDLNLQGTIIPTHVFGKAMARQKSGVVVNISSMTAQQAQTRVLGYSVAKTAIDGFTRNMATEMALKFGEGIRVNAISPGFFLTEQNRNLLTNSDGSLTERGQLIIKNTPFGRFGEANELTGTLLYLCSDASKFVTGVTIPVDGGFSAWNGI